MSSQLEADISAVLCGGNEATDIVIDEAAYVPEEIITEVAMPMLATTDGRLTLISTPHGKNHFWKFFRFGKRESMGCGAERLPLQNHPSFQKTFLTSSGS